jgi:hypothetical protein
MKALKHLLLIVYVAFFALSFLASFSLIAAPIAEARWYMHGPEGYQLIDFSQFYQAGQLAVSQHAHQVYDPDIQNQWASSLVAPIVPGKIFYNQSVPFLYVLLVPFGLLPYNLAYVAWCAVTLALAGTALYILVSLVGLLKGASKWLFLVGVFSSIPAYLTIWHGQTTFLLTAAFALVALFLMQKRDLPCGLCLALTTFKPQYLLPWVALIWGLDRKKVLLSLLLVEALLMGLAAIFIGPENIIGYAKVLTVAESSSRFIGVNPQYMVSVRGVLSAFAPHKTAMTITITLLLVSLLPLAAATKAVTNSATKAVTKAATNAAANGETNAAANGETNADTDTRRWLIAITMLLALIVSPHSHYFDCLLLAVPAAITLPTLDPIALVSKSGRAAKLSLSHRIWCGILLAYPILSWPINFVPGLPGLGARELEGIIFLTINLILFWLAFLQLKNIRLEST